MRLQGIPGTQPFQVLCWFFRVINGTPNLKLFFFVCLRDGSVVVAYDSLQVSPCHNL